MALHRLSIADQLSYCCIMQRRCSKQKCLQQHQSVWWRKKYTQKGVPACMRVPADDVAAMTNPPTARPEMTPPPTDPDQIAMMKIATWGTTLTTQRHISRRGLLDTYVNGQGNARR